MFKVYQNILPPTFNGSLLKRYMDYNLQSNLEFPVPNVKSVFHKKEKSFYLRPKTWYLYF